MVSAVVQPFAPTSVSPRQHKLRTYVVLTSKSSRSRLASFSDDGYSTASSSPTSSPATSPLRAARKSLAEPAIPTECLAYESYAAVASRFASASSTELRWSDISRLSLATSPTTPHGKPLSQKARRRQLQRARAASNDHLECHALDFCFEFLDLSDLERAAAVCTAFRDVVKASGRLLVAIYARQWRRDAYMPRAYATLAFEPALAMVQARRADLTYKLSTRSHVTLQADHTLEILNNSLLRVATRGAVDSVRGVDALPVQPCARALGHQVSYFEVAMSGCGSVGVVSLSDPVTRRAYGYGSDEHVGWTGVSCGYHGNDGDFVFNNGAAPYGGEWAPYGPSWGVRNSESNQSSDTPSVVGCGLDLASHRVFFTLNGTFLGFAPFAVPAGEYAAAVSLHEFNDRAVLNAGSAPFRFDIEGFCASL